MSFDAKVTINVSLSGHRNDALRQWALANERNSDSSRAFWAQVIEDVNDAQEAFRASEEGRY